MLRKIKRGLLLTLLFTCTIGSVAYAEVTDNALQLTEESIEVVQPVHKNFKDISDKSKDRSKSKFELLKNEMMSFMTLSAVGDAYESNDSLDTAYPYSSCTKMSGNDFVENYVSASIHDANDNDFYSINLTAGTEYFFHLKNLTVDNDLFLVAPNRQDAWGITQTGTTEEFFYFEAPTTGKYYVFIRGNGNPTVGLNYFFYAGPSVITESKQLDTNLEIKFSGAGTSAYYKFDTNGLVKANSWLKQVSIDSSGSGYWVGFTKRLRSENGNVYSNQVGSGIDYIHYDEYTERADQVWEISGSCTQGTTYFTWRPRVNVVYSYIMQP